MAFGRTAEGVRVVSDSECRLCLLQQRVKILQEKFSEKLKIYKIWKWKKRNKRMYKNLG